MRPCNAYREDDVHERMESHEDDHEPPSPPRKAVQFEAVENGRHAEDLGGVPDEPVKPVENGTPGIIGLAPEESHKRLNETQACREYANIRLLQKRKKIMLLTL